ncbi:MAG: flagellar filament capping protein FliD [Verrucomicrobiota bacterium]
MTGNFLAATKLSSGALERGNNLLYTINGGPTLVSQTNSITEASSGITGLTVEALKASSSPDASNANKQLIATFGGTGGSSDEISTANPHGYLTGDAVRFDTNGTLPSQVNTSTIYYIRKIDDTTVSLHATASEAANGSNPINFGNNPSYSGDNYLYLANPPAAAGESASTVTVTVSNDTSKIKTAINDFIAEYNKVQSLIDTETDVTTDSAGKVKAGTLAGQSDANDIASKLRSEINALVSGLTGVFDQLSDLGIQSNGNDNSITLSDSTALDTALANNLSSVRELFTQSSSGIAAKLSAYLDSTIGEEGSLVTRQDSLTKQISSIDTQITDQERFVQSRRQQLIDSFIAMEKAQAQINQQLQFLKQRFPAA